MHKNGFGISNLQWLMCHKTKQMQSNVTKDSRRFQQDLNGRFNPIFKCPVHKSHIDHMKKLKTYIISAVVFTRSYMQMDNILSG